MTTQATKTTPAKATPAGPAKATPATPAKGKRGRPAGSQVVEVNFSALTVADDEAPKRAGSAPQDNPMAKYVEESWSQRKPGNTTGKGKSVTLPSEAQAKRVQNLIRYAADKLTDDQGNALGAAVQIEKVNERQWKVRFAAKKRKAAPKPKENAS